MICPTCNGTKYIFTFHAAIPCHRCEQQGYVPDVQRFWIEEGKKLKDERISKLQTLREAARILQEAASFLSDMEIGKREPVSDFYKDLPMNEERSKIRKKTQ